VSEDTQQETNAASALEPLPERWQAVVGDLVVEGGIRGGVPELRTTPELLVELLDRLRSLEEPFNRLTDMCGVDHGDRLQVVYFLCRGYTGDLLVVKVDLPRRGASVPSVTALWPAAHWPEREIAEMFGITFDGHPEPGHLLLPDDFEGHPLLKDFECDREHPWLSPDPLREDPAGTLGYEVEEKKDRDDGDGEPA